jgi:hypothetical protein
MVMGVTEASSTSRVGRSVRQDGVVTDAAMASSMTALRAPWLRVIRTLKIGNQD